MLEINIETMAEDLSACIINQMLWDKYDECVLAFAISSKVCVSLVVGGEECLT